ncbi:MAG: hypothetical protein D6741_18530, partial [Planctomycetota bacterium]
MRRSSDGRTGLNRLFRGGMVVGLAAFVAIAFPSAAWAVDSAVRAYETQLPDYTPGPMLSRFLAGPMRDVEEIVFAVRVPGRRRRSPPRRAS